MRLNFNTLVESVPFPHLWLQLPELVRIRAVAGACNITQLGCHCISSGKMPNFHTTAQEFFYLKRSSGVVLLLMSNLGQACCGMADPDVLSFV